MHDTSGRDGPLFTQMALPSNTQWWAEWAILVCSSVIPRDVEPHEDQTNKRGEVLAAIRATQGHVKGTQSLICRDSTYVVDGMLVRAHKWRHHKWRTQSRLVHHVDLWMQALNLLDTIRSEIKWLHSPSHIGIKGNERANSFADEARRTFV